MHVVQCGVCVCACVRACLHVLFCLPASIRERQWGESLRRGDKDNNEKKQSGLRAVSVPVYLL